VTPQKQPIQEILNLDKPAGYSLECWIETEQHRMIMSHVSDFLIGNSAELWFYGAPGVGKTHLGLLIAERFQFDYYDCSDISPELAPELFEYLNVGTGVVLDRVDRWLHAATSESALFSWWKRKENGLVLISETSPRADECITLPDLASRAHAAMILPLDGLDDDGIGRLFRCQFERLGIELAPEVVRFLSPRLPRNPAKLMDLLAAMDQESLRDQRKITVPWLKQLLLRLS
jgi:DnaA family protein